MSDAGTTHETNAKDPADRPGYYHPSMIVVHWTIVFLLIFQFATSGRMEAQFEMAQEGVQRIGLAGALYVHGLIGTAILALMVWRFTLRRHYVVPPPPETEPEMLQKVSRGVHYAFYVLLIAMPVFGWLAVATGSGLIGWAHKLAGYALIVLILAHVAGALWHAFKKDGVVKRVLRQDPAGQHDTRTDVPKTPAE